MLPLRSLALVTLGSLVALACRTWEETAVVALLSVPIAADASCARLARALAAHGVAPTVQVLGNIDVSVVAADETLIIRGHIPHYSFRTRAVHHLEPSVGYDLALQCPMFRDDTPLPVRVCQDGDGVFGVVEPGPLRTLPVHGTLADRHHAACRLWGRLWTGDRTHAWMRTVLVRPSPRELLAETP